MSICIPICPFPSSRLITRLDRHLKCKEIGLNMLDCRIIRRTEWENVALHLRGRDTVPLLKKMIILVLFFCLVFSDALIQTDKCAGGGGGEVSRS